MTPLRIPCLAIACLLPAPTAGAVTVKAAGAFGTRDQLRDCLDLDDRLKARAQAMEAATAANNQRFDANQVEAGQRVAMKKTLDRGDDLAISTFNQRVQDHDLQVRRAHQADADGELANTAYAAHRSGAEQKCGRLTYRPGDLDALAKERRKATPSPPSN